MKLDPITILIVAAVVVVVILICRNKKYEDYMPNRLLGEKSYECELGSETCLHSSGVSGTCGRFGLCFPSFHLDHVKGRGGYVNIGYA